MPYSLVVSSSRLGQPGPTLGNLPAAMVAAGSDHTVLLTSDGTAVACGENRPGQCDAPALAAGQA